MCGHVDDITHNLVVEFLLVRMGSLCVLVKVVETGELLAAVAAEGPLAGVLSIRGC